MTVGIGIIGAGIVSELYAEAIERRGTGGFIGIFTLCHGSSRSTIPFSISHRTDSHTASIEP